MNPMTSNPMRYPSRRRRPMVTSAPNGIPPNAFSTVWKTDNPGTSNDNQIALPLFSGTYDFIVDWGDGSQDHITSPSASHTYSTPGTYEIWLDGQIPSFVFFGGGDAQKLLSIDRWGSLQLGSFGYHFYGCSNLVVNADDAPAVGTSLNSTFRGCTQFNNPLTNWDTSGVTNCASTFRDCVNLDQNFRHLNLSWVENFSNFLLNCTLSTNNYDELLIGFYSDWPMRANLSFHGGNSTYSSEAADERLGLIVGRNWAITDGGLAP